MSSISESLYMLADAIRSLNPYENPTVKIQEPKVGMQVGTCLNCRRAVVLRQPWLSKMPVVNDGWYVMHCENEKNSKPEMTIADYVIPFEKRNFRLV